MSGGIVGKSDGRRDEVERGELLYLGRKGTLADTIDGQKKIFAFYLSMGCLFVFLLILSLTGSNRIAQLALSLSSLLFIWITFFIAAGFEVDGIFENGLTFMNSNIVDKRKGSSFHKHDEISLIYYGRIRTANGESNYLRIVGRYLPDRKRDGDYICENLFINDYFNRLQETLKEKCANAEWIEENEV